MNNILRETLISKEVTQEMIENETICPICLGNFEAGDKFIKLPCKSLDGNELNHCFHDCEKCSGITKWLDTHSTCPYCRYDFNINQNEENSIENNISELVDSIDQLDNYINNLNDQIFHNYINNRINTINSNLNDIIINNNLNDIIINSNLNDIIINNRRMINNMNNYFNNRIIMINNDY